MAKEQMPDKSRQDPGRIAPNENQRAPRTRIFIGLLLVTCACLVALAVVLWWVPYVGLGRIHPSLPLVLALIFAGLVLFVLGGAFALIVTLLRGKNFFFNRRIRGAVIRILFPLLVVVGRCLGISKDEIRRSFVAINNRLVLSEARRVKPEKLLLLLPHCLQHHECPVRITADISHCKGCGKCVIKDLVALSGKYGVPVSVATGGTLARRIVVETRPEVIIGVACERDLTSGIQDTYPIPVFGILNRRPNGPCYDTEVDLTQVESGLKVFLDGEKADSARSGSGGA